jgi:hypothetical protein
MVVFTPITPLPATHMENTPVTPYEVLDHRMDTMTTQLDEIMGHFLLSLIKSWAIFDAWLQWLQLQDWLVPRNTDDQL